MNRIVLLIVFAVSVLFAYKNFKSPNVKSIQLATLYGPFSDYKEDQSSKISKCTEKSFCLVVYVAPWCSACHHWIQTFPQFKNMLEVKGVETLVIVGADEERQNEIAFLPKVSMFNSILDSPENIFRKTYGVDRFPFFMVIDSNQKVIRYGRKSIDFVNEKLNEK